MKKSVELLTTGRGNRNLSIDIAKGIAIILMVIGHCYHEDNLILKFIYAFHMPFFFIVSGFLYSGKDKINLPKQTRSLLMPYLIFDGLFAVFLYVSSGFQDLLSKAISILSLTGVTATWFLPCLFICEGLFVLLKFTNKFRLPIITVFLVFGLLSPKFPNLIVLQRAFVGLGFFAVGYYAPLLFSKLHKWYFQIIALALFLLSTLFNDPVSIVDLKFSDPFLYVMSSLSGSYLLIQLSYFIGKFSLNSNKLLIYLGQNTLIVLCTHMFYVEAIRMIDYKLFNNILYNFSYFEGLLFGIIVVALEIITIFISNRYLWLLFGKKRMK